TSRKAATRSSAPAKRSAADEASARDITSLKRRAVRVLTPRRRRTASSVAGAGADCPARSSSGGWPTSISYSTHARLYRSVRASIARLPISCSGLMYASDPTGRTRAVGLQNRHDVWVAELRGELHFADEALAEGGGAQLGGHHLHRHRAGGVAFVGQIHAGHAPRPDLVLHRVVGSQAFA